MMTTSVGTTGGLEAALQADIERLQDEGKTERQQVKGVHQLALAQQGQNIAKLKDEAKQIGGFSIFTFILDLIVGFTGTIGDYFSPLTAQVSKMLDAGGNFARKIYSLVEFINKEPKSKNKS